VSVVLDIKANPKVVAAVADQRRTPQQLPKIEKSNTTIKGAGLSCLAAWLAAVKKSIGKGKIAVKSQLNFQ